MKHPIAILVVVRAGEAVELPLTFGEREDGGTSLGLRLQIVMAPDSASGEATLVCPGWIEETYRVETLMRDLDLDLSEQYASMRECVGRDAAMMAPDSAVKYCDNVFKIHCSGVDLLAEIGEAPADRCKSRLESSLGVDLDKHKGWKTCGQHKAFYRYSATGAADTAGCRAVFPEACGTDLGAVLGSGRASDEQRAFADCCKADRIEPDACGMIDETFERGPCHDRPVCINRHTTEWIRYG